MKKTAFRLKTQATCLVLLTIILELAQARVAMAGSPPKMPTRYHRLPPGDTNISAIYQTPTRIDVVWDKQTDADGFYIYRAKSAWNWDDRGKHKTPPPDSDFELIGAAPAGATRFSDRSTNFLGHTLYFYRMSAFNKNGESMRTPIRRTITYERPDFMEYWQAAAMPEGQTIAAWKATSGTLKSAKTWRWTAPADGSCGIRLRDGWRELGRFSESKADKEMTIETDLPAINLANPGYFALGFAVEINQTGASAGRRLFIEFFNSKQPDADKVTACIDAQTSQPVISLAWSLGGAKSCDRSVTTTLTQAGGAGSYFFGVDMFSTEAFTSSYSFSIKNMTSFGHLISSVSSNPKKQIPKIHSTATFDRMRIRWEPKFTGAITDLIIVCNYPKSSQTQMVPSNTVIPAAQNSLSRTVSPETAYSPAMAAPLAISAGAGANDQNPIVPLTWSWTSAPNFSQAQAQQIEWKHVTPYAAPYNWRNPNDGVSTLRSVMDFRPLSTAHGLKIAPTFMMHEK